MEKDKETAEEMRKMSMVLPRRGKLIQMSHQKKSGEVQFLKEHSVMEFQFKREELEAKKN